MDEPLRSLVGQCGEPGSPQADLGVSSSARAFPMKQTAHHGRTHVVRRQDVHHGHRHFGRRPVWGTVHRHESRFGLHDHVVRQTVGALLKADQPHVHEVGKRVGQLVGQKAHGVEVAPFHVLKEHVRVGQGVLEPSLALGRFEVVGHDRLAMVGRFVIAGRRARSFSRQLPRPGDVATWGFHLGHVRATLGQKRARQGAGQHARQIEHADAFQHTFHALKVQAFRST